MVATVIRLRSPSPSRDRYRSPSPRRAEGRGVHVKKRLGKRVAPYDERVPSPSPDRSQARGDVRDRLAWPRENPRFEVPEESSGSFYNLVYTASHEIAVDRQRECQHREHDERARRRDRDRDRYYRRERSPSRDYREHRHREEVYDRRPARVADPPVVITPKTPQTKVEMVLEQLVSSPFTEAIKSARPPEELHGSKVQPI